MSLPQRLKAILDDFRRRGDTLDRRMDEAVGTLEILKNKAESNFAGLTEQLRQLAEVQQRQQEQLNQLQQNVGNNSAVSHATKADNVQERAPYYSMSVQDCTYFYNSADRIIPAYMIATGKTYSEENMLSFVQLANKLHYNGTAPKNGCFLEIGANIGTTTVYCKKKLTPDLKFLVFEPVEDNARLLTANCAINGIMDDVCIVHGALSDRERESAKIYVNQENRGGSGLVEQWEKPEELEACVTMTLDGYLKEHNGIEEICYAWIDTEGHEYHVLSGAKETFRRRIPTCLEYNQGSYKSGGIYDSMLILLNELFNRFIVLNIPDKSVRPISELPMLWDEHEGLSCDLFLF